MGWQPFSRLRILRLVWMAPQLLLYLQFFCKTMLPHQNG
jgi:hypothetical protein